MRRGIHHPALTKRPQRGWIRSSWRPVPAPIAAQEARIKPLQNGSTRLSRAHLAGRPQPGNLASSTQAPAPRPAQTGPQASFRRAIAFGVNGGEGVYTVRQLTPLTHCPAAPSQVTAVVKSASLLFGRLWQPPPADDGRRSLQERDHSPSHGNAPIRHTIRNTPATMTTTALKVPPKEQER